jgi:hypothetical protein
MPAAHHLSAICPSRQRLTLVEWSRQISIIDSIVILSRGQIHVSDVRVCDLDGVSDAASQDGPTAPEIFLVEA